MLSITTFIFFLSILNVAHASFGGSVTCDNGVSYYKTCQTACNKGYENCISPSDIVIDNVYDQILSADDGCNKGLAACMTTCSKTSADMCTATSGSAEGGGSGKGNCDGVKLTSEGIYIIVIDIMLIVAFFTYHLMSNKCKTYINEKEEVEHSETIGNHDLNEERSIIIANGCVGQGRIDNPEVLSSLPKNTYIAPHSMVKSAMNSVHTPVPGIQSEEQNQDQISLLQMQACPMNIDLLV